MPDASQPGRGQGGGGAANVAAGFKVDDSSIRKLNTQWAQLVRHVRDFNAELKKIDPRKLGALGSAMGGGSVGVLGNSLSAGSFSVRAGNGLPVGTTAPSGFGGFSQAAGSWSGRAPGSITPSPMSGPSGGGGGGGGAGTAAAAGKHWPWQAKAGLATVGAIGAYGARAIPAWTDIERYSQQMAWGSSGQTNHGMGDMRHYLVGLSGYTSQDDLLAGAGYVTNIAGYGNARANTPAGNRLGAAFQNMSAMSAVLGSAQQGGAAANNLYSSQNYYKMLGMGIRTRLPNGGQAAPSAIASQLLDRVYGGRKRTAEDVGAGMAQGEALRATMDSLGLDTDTQQYIGQFGMLQAKMRDKNKKISDADVATQLAKVAGKSKDTREVVGTSFYDTQRVMAQTQSQNAQQLADSALPAMRKQVELTTDAFKLLNGALGKPGVGTTAGMLGLGASPVAGALNFGGGLLGNFLMMRMLGHTLSGPGKPGTPKVARMGVGEMGLRGGAAVGGIAAGMGLDWASKKVIGDNKVGRGVGNTLGMAATGAGIGTMIAPGYGTVIGAGIGAGLGLGKSLFEGFGGPGDAINSSAGGSVGRNEIDLLTGAFGSIGSSSATGTTATDVGPTSPGDVAFGDSPSGRGAKALAWMSAQSKNPLQNWHNLCLTDVRTALGVGRKYKDAASAFMNTKKRHGGTPPPGVPVWWTGGQGHVALSAGGGKVWSNDIRRDGQIDLVPISEITRKWGKPYQGWSEDINEVDVYSGTATKAAGGGAKSVVAGGSHVMSPAQVYQLAKNAGFSSQQAIMMTAIAGAESDYDSHQLTDNKRTGDLSYGLWQINMLGGLGPERRRSLHLASNNDLLNPTTNARAAWEISGHGHTVMPWSTYKSGRYRKYMAGAQAASQGVVRPYATGSYDIQGDQMAMVHHGEMVIPTRQANVIRDYVRRRTVDPSTSATAATTAGARHRGGNSITLHMPIHMPAGTGVGDAQRIVSMVARVMENDQRLAAVMGGD